MKKRNKYKKYGCSKCHGTGVYTETSGGEFGWCEETYTIRCGCTKKKTREYVAALKLLNSFYDNNKIKEYDEIVS